MSLFEIHNKEDNSPDTHITIPDESVFINQRAFKDIKKQLSAIQRDKCYHLKSAGSWSLYELIVYLANQIGQSSLIFSTWAISEEACLAFSGLKEKKILCSVSGIFDQTTESHKNSALTICRTFFDHLAFAHLHAKVAVLQSKDWNISIVSTANMTNNPRHERTVIFTNHLVGEFDSQWLKQLIKP